MELNDKILNLDALQFILELNERFNARRLNLLEERKILEQELKKGNFNALINKQDFPENWKVATTPPDLIDRRVEITGPAERKMIINALNSGANCFMADFEDSLSPTWKNIIDGHKAIYDAVRQEIDYRDETTGKEYKLNETTATLLVRPRGWHMDEKNITINGRPISASLFDFGLHFFNNSDPLILIKGSGPYFYLPKLESYKEAELWKDVFEFSEQFMGYKVGTIRATVLIETFPAAFQMENILFALRNYISGLNAGRWDYLFSMIKKLGFDQSKIFSDRSELTMTQPFMQTYCEMLVKVCHKHGAHAMGGMSAFIPSRKDAEINKAAFQKVKEDKEREFNLGFDGTWVAHPDLVPVAKEVFTVTHQKDKQIDKNISFDDLFPNVTVKVTEEGVKNNFFVAAEYIDNWLNGKGAVTINNLMEDAATAEISRTQLWQWYKYDVLTTDNKKVRDIYQDLLSETQFLSKSLTILDEMIKAEKCPDFLTTRSYKELN